MDGVAERVNDRARRGGTRRSCHAAPERSVVNSVVYEDPAALRDATTSSTPLARHRAGPCGCPTTTTDGGLPRARATCSTPTRGDGRSTSTRSSDPAAAGLRASTADPERRRPLNDARLRHRRARSRARWRDCRRARASTPTRPGPAACLHARPRGRLQRVDRGHRARGPRRAYRGADAHALADARERGRTTSTLQATDLGRADLRAAAATGRSARSRCGRSA